MDGTCNTNGKEEKYVQDTHKFCFELPHKASLSRCYMFRPPVVGIIRGYNIIET